MALKGAGLLAAVVAAGARAVSALRYRARVFASKLARPAPLAGLRPLSRVPTEGEVFAWRRRARRLRRSAGLA